MGLDGETIGADAVLGRLGLAPLEFAPKEGLAMVNGTQVSLALALEGLFAFEDVFAATILAGALSVEAALGSAGPFDPRIHEVRGQRGQADIAAVYLDLLGNSEFRAANVDAGRVQDPYSLRCQPQVLGTCLDTMRFSVDILSREINAMTDNPLIFADTGDILYGGNFHAEPVGMAADVLALALAETGSMAERRIALLVDANMSGLPPFLAAESGLNSGFMVAHVTAAALASENKALANPRGTDSLPTTANFEDYVSMATHASRRLVEMADNLAGIVAIELLASCQGVYLRRPLRSSPVLEGVVEQVHGVAPPFDEDRFFAPSIAAVKSLIVDGRFRAIVPAEILPTGEG
jgi:histidine ammonia-lyase